MSRAPPIVSSSAVAARGTSISLPTATPTARDFEPDMDTRQGRLRAIANARELAHALRADVRFDGFGGGRLTAAGAADFELEALEARYRREFLAPHGRGQYLCPPCLLSSPVFAVRSKSLPRAASVALSIPSGVRGTYRYEGPELRQGDLRVLLSLFNCAKDFRLGVSVSVPTGELCQVVLGSSGGSARARLRRVLERLSFGAMLCPDGELALLLMAPMVNSGEVAFALDKGLASLFDERGVWMDRSIHDNLSTGLASWCYGMIRSYAALIPWPLARLKQACGAIGSSASFRDLAVRTMPELVAAGVIDSGWSIRREVLRWRRPGDVQTSVTAEVLASR